MESMFAFKVVIIAIGVAGLFYLKQFKEQYKRRQNFMRFYNHLLNSEEYKVKGRFD